MEPGVLKTKGKLVSANASLQIYGDELDFEAISRELRVSATRTRRKGDLTQSGKVIENDLWSITSPLERNLQLDDHLRWLAKALQPRAAFIRTLVRGPNIRRINVFSAVTINGESDSVTLSHEALSFLAELEIGMELSLVFLNLSGPEEIVSDQRPDGPVSFPKNDKYRTESHVRITVPNPNPELRTKLSALGLRLATAQEKLIDAADFQVPLPEVDDVDTQLKWLVRALSLNDSLVPWLIGSIDITCSFGTECEWGGTWLSGEAFRLPVQLRVPLRFELQLL